MAPPPQKPKEERLTETLTILQKLRDVGIADTDPGFLLIKKHMSDWVKTGDSAVHRVDFLRHGRRGELILPSRAGRAATLSLKVVAAAAAAADTAAAASTEINV